MNKSIEEKLRKRAEINALETLGVISSSAFLIGRGRKDFPESLTLDALKAIIIYMETEEPLHTLVPDSLIEYELNKIISSL